MLPITFLSDYGHEDEFVGVCHGVIQRIAPGAVVIDIAHALPPHDTRTAALVLRNTLPYMPQGVHLAVVDPGVGTERRAVALQARDGRLFVGPDNGLLSLAFERRGGVESAVDLSESSYRLEPVSATFHGRDLFAPVAARLALGSGARRGRRRVPGGRARAARAAGGRRCAAGEVRRTCSLRRPLRQRPAQRDRRRHDARRASSPAASCGSMRATAPHEARLRAHVRRRCRWARCSSTWTRTRRSRSP